MLLGKAPESHTACVKVKGCFLPPTNIVEWTHTWAAPRQCCREVIVRRKLRRREQCKPVWVRWDKWRIIKFNWHAQLTIVEWLHSVSISLISINIVSCHVWIKASSLRSIAANFLITFIIFILYPLEGLSSYLKNYFYYWVYSLFGIHLFGSICSKIQKGSKHPNISFNVNLKFVLLV